MSDKTAIEWTDATWNPTTGCTQVSPGCDHCYALTLSERFRGTPGHYFENGFDVQLRPAKLDQPLRWKKPRKVFVNWSWNRSLIESGRGARPMDAEWARQLRDQCQAGGVAFHFKQWGAHGPDGIRASKHDTGRVLDGRTWDEFPGVVA